MVCAEKQEFFDDMAKLHLALTYDDVRLNPARGEGVVTPETDISSHFSRNVDLKIPMVSAAMDTVTTAPMAIAMAKLGGLGVIHAGLSIEDQKRAVRRVKLEFNPIIDKPVTVRPYQTVESVLNRISDKGYSFHTFPVVDSDNRLTGVLTGSDIEFNDSPSRRVKSIMTPLEKVVSVPKGTDVSEAYRQMKRHKVKMLPVVGRGNVLQGLYLWSNVSDIVRGDSAPYNVDKEGRLRVAAALPTDEEALERVQEMRHYLDVAVLDTAQGDSRFAFATLELLKKHYPDLDVVVGNVSVPDSARDLVRAGADGIKVGQGPGSICTTRIETGMGRPQVTAVYECTRAVATIDENVPVCADGGIVNNGDVPIALAVGAHSVMMGSKLAGTDEAPGEIILGENGLKSMLYRGMGSPSALRESAAARKRYGQAATASPLPEGVESLVDYRGPVTRVVADLVKALRKSMSYVGAPNIEYLRSTTTMIRVTNSGMRESYPHELLRAWFNGDRLPDHGVGQR